MYFELLPNPIDDYKCEEAGITTYLPKPQTSDNQSKGFFGKRDFHYIPEDDEYHCPAGERLIWRMTNEEKGQTLHRYWSSNCQTCTIKSQCTTSKQRRVTRWEHESVLETMQERLDRDPEKMRTHRETVEHPFGHSRFGWAIHTSRLRHSNV